MTDVELRAYDAEDEPAVLRLLSSSLGWLSDERYRDFFRWKHLLNPFGPSSSWVAVSDGEVVGFRTFLRWEFDHEGQVVRAARAVDTATDPRHQGRGIFSRLTLSGLEGLRDDGVDFVFNTPNDQSRPGYLKMGWQLVGRLPVRARPRGPSGVLRMARARQPAERWMDATGGVDPDEVLHDSPLLDDLLTPDDPGRLTTRKTAAFLRWRYAGFAPLAYRAHLAGPTVADGLVLYRLRRRGHAVETVIAEVLVHPEARRADRAALVRGALRASGGDYALGIGDIPALVPLPRQGPQLTWRAVCAVRCPPLDQWGLTLGDTELF